VALIICGAYDDERRVVILEYRGDLVYLPQMIRTIPVSGSGHEWYA
jgi:hypothetical protein